MRNKILFPAFVVLLAGLASLLTPAAIVEQVVAQVNNDVITLTQYNREKNSIYQGLRAQYSGQDLDRQYNQFLKVLLPSMIDELLLMQKAKELGFTEDLDLEVKATVDDMMKRNNIPNVEALKKAMAESGVSYNDFLENLKRQLLANRIKGAIVRQKVKIMNADIENYFKEHPADFTIPEQVEIEDIVLYTKGKNAQEVRVRIEEALKQLQGSKDFHEVAKSYSEGPTAAQGGGIGSFTVTSLSRAIAAAVSKLQPGQISGIIEADYGFEIIRLLSRTPQTIRPMEEVRSEIENRLFQARLEPILADYLKELREESYIFIAPEFKADYPEEEKAKPAAIAPSKKKK